MKKIIIILSLFIFTSANAGMSDKDKSKAWDCVGIYMANYFLPSGEKFEYGMKEKSISTVKVLKTYALEIGITEKDWDAGVNKAVDKHYGSKYDKAKTNKCHAFVESLVPNGAERAKVAVVEKTIGTVTPDKSTVMFKIFCIDEPALHKFIEGTEVSKPIMDAVLDSYTIYNLSKV